MPLDINNLLQAVQLGVESYIPLAAYLREVFINEAPLLMRLPRKPAISESYNIITYDVRPRTYTLNAAITTGGTTLTLVDATPLMPGDVLELPKTDNSAYERVEVLPVALTNGQGLIGATNDGVTVTIRRGVEGTAAVANDTTGGYTTLTLIGNSRTGAEINQAGNRAVRTAIPQQVQTYQFPVTLGGKAQAVETVALPSGVPDIFTLEQRTKATEFLRDIEYGMYYGIGERPSAAGDRAKQSGLRKLIGYYKSGANVKLNAGSSYTRLNFVADGIQKAIDGGGDPDVCVVSTNFLSFIATWTNGAQFFMDPEYTDLGVEIVAYKTAFTGKPMTFIPSYQMRPGTALIGTSKDMKVRYLRQESFLRRAILGDASMGDFLGDFAVEIGHPGWHAWIEGISSVA
jgi:Family of unknown function (DUF5309)